MGDGGSAPQIVHLDTSPGTRLALRHYEPKGPARRPEVVVLVHGLLASAEIFDVPGLERPNLARRLAGEGFHVVSYDQRGTGDSITRSPAFGLAEHALVDLPRVLDRSLSLAAAEPGDLVVGGHSLGGLLIYAQQIAARTASVPGAFGPITNRVFALASPADFRPSMSPWNLIARGGHRLVRRLDRDRDGMVSREEFVAGQSQLRCPTLGRVVGPGLIHAAIRIGIALPWLAGALQRAPLPTFIYGRNDFSRRTFWKLLKSRALDAASLQLLEEIVDATQAGGDMSIAYDDITVHLPNDLSALSDVDLLTVTSESDALVPAASVEAAHSFVSGGRHILTEARFGVPSGHAGYLFRPGLADEVGGMLIRFCSGRPLA